MTKDLKENAQIYIFLDESGKPEVYSSKGANLVEAGNATRFLVLSAVRTTDQLQLQWKIIDFRASLLKDPRLTKVFSSAYTLDAFHAHHDYPEVKERFYRFIATLDIKIDVLVVEKLKCFSSLQRDARKMYGVMAGQLLKNLAHQTDSTEIIFSRKDNKLKLRQQLETEVDRMRIEYLQEHPNLEAKFKLS